jgi:hypothetical protein
VRYARVTLAWVEVERGARLAARRYVNGLRLGRTPTHHQPRERVLWDDLQGIHSEMAHAALRGVPYHPGDELDSRTGDVAGDHVRATLHHSGHLALYPEDDPSARFVLWVGHGARWELAGWLRAQDGQQPRYWRTPTDGQHPPVRFPAYYVPQAALLPWPPAPAQLDGGNAICYATPDGAPGDGDVSGGRGAARPPALHERPRPLGRR